MMAKSRAKKEERFIALACNRLVIQFMHLKHRSGCKTIMSSASTFGWLEEVDFVEDTPPTKDQQNDVRAAAGSSKATDQTMISSSKPAFRLPDFYIENPVDAKNAGLNYTAAAASLKPQREQEDKTIKTPLDAAAKEQSTSKPKFSLDWLETSKDLPLKERKSKDERPRVAIEMARSSSNKPLLQYHDGTLFCREKEREELLQVYQKMKTTTDASKTFVIMLRGPTGVGKTTLANSLRPVVEQDGGYFIMGKFDRRPEPHATIISAFSEFADCVVERGEAEVVRIRLAASEVLCDADRKILLAVIPALAKILGRDTTSTSSDQRSEQTTEARINYAGESLNQSHEIISGSVHRFKQALQGLVRAISSSEKPLVCLFDDFHYADEGSLGLLRNSIIADTDNLGVLVLLTYREDLDSKTDQYIVDKLPTPSEGVMEGTLRRLKNLSEDEVNHLLSKVLSVGSETLRPLSAFVHNQSDGNFLSVFEYIRVLIDDGFLKIKDNRLHWDPEQVKKEFIGTEDLVLRRFSELDEPSRKLLKIASCLGSTLDDSLLIHFSPDNTLRYFHEQAEKKGLLVFNHQMNSWSFAHDRVNEAIYENLLPKEREELHYRIGRSLWKSFDMTMLDRRIFVVVGHLMEAECLTNGDKEKVAVAKLCLRAGERAVFLSSFYTAHLYLMHGIRLLEPRLWRDEYDFCLAIHNAGAEIAFCSGHADIALKLVDSILSNARTASDTFRGREIKICALGSRFQLEDANECIKELLSLVEEPMPSRPTNLSSYLAIRKLKRILKAKSSASILRLPIMDDANKIAAMQALNLSFRFAFATGGMNIASWMALRMTQLTLEFGLSPVSCVGFSIAAAGLCATGSYDEGFRIGQVALALNEMLNAKPFYARMSALYYECVHPWERPLQSAIEPLVDAYSTGIETGDVEFAFVCFNCSWMYRFSYTPLHLLSNQMHDFSRRMDFHSIMDQCVVKALWQVAHNLMGIGSDDPRNLDGDIFNQALVDEAQSKNTVFTSLVCFPRMMLCYMFGDFHQAAKFAIGSRKASNNSRVSPVGCSRILVFEALTEIAVAREKKRKRSRRANFISKLLGRWSSRAPHNFLSFHLLIEGEMAALKGDHGTAFPKYVAAIAMAKETGSLLDRALSNELCGRYFLRRNDQSKAENFFRDAVLAYSKWDASKKARHLVKELKIHSFDSLKDIV